MRVRLAGDQADEALVLAQHGEVHGLAVQALGGVKLERAVDAQHVDRADLRHHVGGDQHHDLVEAFLRADRLRHHFAKPAQQHARTAERATHGVRSLGPALNRSVARIAPAVIRRGIRRGTGPRRSLCRPIANAVCKPQAKDAAMTKTNFVRRSES